MPDRFGALASTWELLHNTLHLTADLLPAVGNPNAKISPYSKLVGVGQTPSKYKENGQVVGFHQWTQHQATDRDIALWRRQPDYNIALQCRRVMALDCDVTVNPQADNILAYLDSFTMLHLGLVLPIRRREGSTKWLCFFMLEGDYTKQIMRVDGGMIENLARGQQFIVDGTHPSGTRYQLDMRGNKSVPVLTAEQFAWLWEELADFFGVAPPEKLNNSVRQRGADIAMEDNIIDQLDVLSWGKHGEAYITCPFASEHTTESGETATVYFPAGTNGYQQGHFKCLHAHCAGRDDSAFVEALGIAPGGFDMVEIEEEKAVVVSEAYPALERMSNGRIKTTLLNLQKALNHAGMCGLRLRQDVFKEETLFASADKDDWQPLTDVCYVALREKLESRGFMPIGRELIRDAVMLNAERNKFDSAQEWLKGLEWDGVHRVSNFVRDCFGAEDNRYSGAVARYMWSAMAGRIMQPGAKADMVPILQGEQGVMKSTVIAALVPHEELFIEISLSERDDDLARRTKGRLVAEIGELQGLGTRELEGIKAYITRQYDNWIPKYREQTVNYARRVVFFGTTNEDEFLADSTNRRFLPVHVKFADVERIKRDRLQLWAEARELFDVAGVCWQEAQKLAPEHQDSFKVHDTWTDEISTWLDTPLDGFEGVTPASGNTGVCMKDVLVSGLGIPVSKIRRTDEIRAGKAMRALGYLRHVTRVSGVLRKVWFKG